MRIGRSNQYSSSSSRLITARTRRIPGSGRSRRAWSVDADWWLCDGSVDSRSMTALFEFVGTTDIARACPYQLPKPVYTLDNGALTRAHYMGLVSDKISVSNLLIRRPGYIMLLFSRSNADLTGSLYPTHKTLNVTLLDCIENYGVWNAL